MFTKIINFVKNVIKNTFKTIKDFIVDSFNNFEAIIILLLSSLGVSVILSEVLFFVSFPLWIETPMVIPILSVIIVSSLVTVLKWRINYVENKSKTS